MAAVFQRPMPILDDAQDNQIRQQRRRRDSVEVIDVDELDDVVYLPHRAPEPGPSRPAQRRRISTPSEIISLLDSDDDDLVMSASSVRPASRTRLQSPPPRNQPWPYVPPVPPVPHRYAGHTSLPMRRQGPAFASPPVVRPSEEPFPFETNMRQQQPQHHPAPVPGPGPSNRPPPIHIPRGNVPNILPPRPLQAAPPSHHVPALGLGGALIAQNRARQQHQHRPHPSYEAGNSFFGRVGSGVRRILGGPALAPEEGPRNAINFLALGNNWGFLDDPLSDDDELLAIQALAEDEGEGFRDLEPAFNPARAYIRSEVFRRRNNVREESPYRKEYTHPGPPETGFSFDFAPKSPVEVIDVTSPEFTKKRIPSPEPIIIDDEDDSMIHDLSISRSAVPAASSTSIPSLSKQTPQTPQTPPKSSTAGTTVLACARCLDPLVLSNNLTSDIQKNRRVWGLRCGHLIDGKCLKEIGQPPYTDQSTDIGSAISVVDRKGKGKAKAGNDESIRHDEGMHIVSTHDHEQPDNNANSIRSRLRPRHVAAVASSSSSHPPAKRNTRGKQPQMPPAEYIWHCPVTGCDRIHVSLKINGEWVPEREELTSGPSGSSVGGRGRGRGAGRGRGRTSLFGILNANEDQPHQPHQPQASGSEGARGAIPLFL
ncbi:hypothetical protein P691DRAFT_811906 [Macrolepiota fuliginosa MF-IS2]|uniref:Uncharacterized protein n=1 Tax=Macrolepiota fuliginosa MF-IS2 TaxID=1400762 RepID=A0A9P5XG54_9AGAR|nr:hypothetical protein P691DRAFT_811906 [Macrolepiota fuliginosa MF-IS2]